MRISLLLRREPFGDLLTRTLAAFWDERYGQPFQVAWLPGRPARAFPRRTRAQQWLANGYLNAIFVPGADPAVFEPIRREFSRSAAWWRRPAQRLYVFAGLSRPGAPWLAHARLEVWPAVPEAEQWLIVPGNHKLRLLDRRANLSYGVLKSGFRPDFMQAELAARRTAARCGVPVPALLEVGGDERWFCERYLVGTPANRLPQRAEAARAVAGAAATLANLYRASQRAENRQDYVLRLHAQVQGLAVQGRLIDSGRRDCLTALASALADLCRAPAPAPAGTSVDLPDTSLLTALTHGDFQSANILSNADGVWLIDWEYAARRQVAYDALVYLLAARAVTGLGERLRQFVERGWPAAAPFADLESAAPAGPGPRRRQAALFLLEELALRCAENAEPVFTCVDAGFDGFLDEAHLWLEMTRER